MVFNIETTERIRGIGNSHYINLRKDFMELLDLEKGDFVKITIEKVKITIEKVKKLKRKKI
ncbi:hypothetical protein ES705_34571 [subsurface metagenome]